MHQYQLLGDAEFDILRRRSTVEAALNTKKWSDLIGKDLKLWGEVLFADLFCG